MTSPAEVISFSAKKAELRPAAACACHEHYTCYSHRVLAAADRLRALPDVAEGDAWVTRSEVRRLVAVVLSELDAITAECLPDERNVR